MTRRIHPLPMAMTALLGLLPAADLMNKLKKRSDARVPLAAFDYGYLVEAFREAAAVFRQPTATEK